MFSFSVIPLCLRQAWHSIENFEHLIENTWYTEYLIENFGFLSQEIIPSCLKKTNKPKEGEIEGM